MRKDFKPQSYFCPLPVVLIGTYDEANKPDCMNAAWGGIHDTNEVYLCLSADHKTSINIKLNKEFTITFGDVNHVVEADYVGIKSGNKESNKVEKAKFKYIKSDKINAPIFDDFPLTLECKVKTMDEANDTLYIVGSIINISVSDKALDEDGKIDASKINPIVYNPVNNCYHEVGKIVGHAFKDGLKIK